jgi:hypothetical protein
MTVDITVEHETIAGSKHGMRCDGLLRSVHCHHERCSLDRNPISRHSADLQLMQSGVLDQRMQQSPGIDDLFCTEKRRALGCQILFARASTAAWSNEEEHFREA